ncbi:MAG: nuclear transport factor 2 family protein [Bacteroidia bacterium]|nr:nuclear transport factor 2 family protein [Bacteroidia bacterium]
MKPLFTLFIVFAFVLNVTSQTNQHLKDINVVWSEFYAAFEQLDHTKMTAIHHEDLIRISGGKRIRDYKSYMNSNRASFEALKAKNMSTKIELRFFERIANEKVSSERGIYKLTQSDGTSSPNHYYGQFHVIMEKIDGQWLITMDYDSNENNTIGEEAFMKAYTIDNFEPF